MHFVDGSQVHVWIGHQGLEFFLCAFCRSGSACATMGRGLRKRNPNCLNSLWLWRTDRKSTRLNSSHLGISYAVFCLKKKKHMEVGRCVCRVGCVRGQAVVRRGGG